MNYLNHRSQKIDFLRGIAILLVLFLHFNLAYHLDQSILNRVFSVNFINAFFGNGNYGVTMFFVISGFLITSISLERYHGLRNINIGNFYFLRFARIMPCLLLALFIIVVLSFTTLSIFANKPQTVSLFVTIISILTFWHNILMQKVGYFNYCLNIYWSLSVEEVFYLVFPLLCIAFKKTRYLCLFLIALIIVGPIYRSFYENNEIISLYGYFSCFDAIALGCCTAILAQKVQIDKKYIRLIKCAAWTLGIIVYFYNGIMQNVVFGVSLIAICTSILLFSSQSYSTYSNDWFTRGVSWYGKNSYELYLFHIIILALMKQLIAPTALGDYGKLIWLLCFLSSSALIGNFITNYYSQPLNTRLRQALRDDKKFGFIQAFFRDKLASSKRA